MPIDGTTWTLRNVYVHDTLDGFESGNSTNLTVNMYNSVFARNGGGAGPDHNVYIGAGNLGSTANVINSVFEQANLGHSFKTRALQNNFTCSMFLLNEDNVYLGSQDIDIDGGTPVINKSLLVNANGAGSAWNNQNSWDNGKFAVDNEAGYTVNNEAVTNSNIVNDQNNTIWPMILGIRFTGPNPVPATWSETNLYGQIQAAATCRERYYSERSCLDPAHGKHSRCQFGQHQQLLHELGGGGLQRRA